MDDLSLEAAAAFLEQYASGLHGTSSLKWTGEFGAVSGAETRLLAIAGALRQAATGSPPRFGADDAAFLRSQAESLRGPNRMMLGDPMDTAERRLVTERTFQEAEKLDAIAALVDQRSR